MSDGGVALKMRGHVSADSIRYFWKLLGGLLGGLFYLALLAGEVEERSFESLGNEVGGDSILIDAGGGDDFFKVIAECSRLDERFFLFVLIVILAVVGIRFDKGNVL